LSAVYSYGPLAAYGKRKLISKKVTIIIAFFGFWPISRRINHLLLDTSSAVYSYGPLAASGKRKLISKIT